MYFLKQQNDNRIPTHRIILSSSDRVRFCQARALPKMKFYPKEPVPMDNFRTVTFIVT